MDHKIVLDKIKEIEIFFNHLGLKKVKDLPKDWNLDSCINYVTKDFNFTVNNRGDERILIGIDVKIMGGLEFILSGKYKPEIKVYEKVQTDYDFRCKYYEHQFFTSEFRDYKINNFLDNKIKV